MHRHRCDVLDLVGPTPGRLLFGPAVTLSYLSSCGERLPAKRYNFARLFYEAIGKSGVARMTTTAAPSGNRSTPTCPSCGRKLSMFTESPPDRSERAAHAVIWS